MPPQKPNILFIMADQIRWDALAVNGAHWMHTPNLDRLARGGINFPNAFSPDPICVPARASITTGNYPHVATGNKANSGQIRDDQVKFAEHFAAAGYRTYAMGKLHYVPYQDPPLLHGLQTVELYESGRARNVGYDIEDYY
ncbi:MAG: sulfatase-like hydrolase/transferase, partial [Armatimonadota bacterium]